MTAFFANIQVQCDVRDAVIDAVVTQITRAGFRPEAEQYGGDRSIYVGPDGDGWIGVYDSLADGINVGPLAWLAQRLSAHLTTVTLAWMMHDTALLYLLFERGDVVDRYVSRPAVFQPPDSERPARPVPPLGGDGERLLEATGIAGDGRLVGRWLAHPDPYPQVTLARVAAVLGQVHADLGHADIEDDILAGGLLVEPADFTRLEFVRQAANTNDVD